MAAIIAQGVFAAGGRRIDETSVTNLAGTYKTNHSAGELALVLELECSPLPLPSPLFLFFRPKRPFAPARRRPSAMLYLVAGVPLRTRRLGVAASAVERARAQPFEPVS